jgi:hypothetical protein
MNTVNRSLNISEANNAIKTGLVATIMAARPASISLSPLKKK